MERAIRLPLIICIASSLQWPSFRGGECSSEFLHGKKKVVYFIRCTSSFLANKIASSQLARLKIQYTHSSDLLLNGEIKMSPPPILPSGVKAHRVVVAREQFILSTEACT